MPQTINALEAIAANWNQARPNGPRIGIGDISFQGGGLMPPHKSHQVGLDADIRLMRNDGRELPIKFQDPAYSRTLTQELVNRIIANGILRVQYIFFNDPQVQSVRPWPGHDNHLHVRFYPPGNANPFAAQRAYP
jgi:murein endopeptidase